MQTAALGEDAVIVYADGDKICFKSNAPIKIVFNDPWKDGRVSIFELLSRSMEDSFVFKVAAECNVRMHVDANMEHIDEFIADAFSSIFGDTGFSGIGLPRILFDLKIDINAFFDTSNENDDITDPDNFGEPAESYGYNISIFRFDMVQLDLGRLLNSIVKPILGGVMDILDPVFTIIGGGADAARGFINEPLPGLEEVGIDFSVADLLGSKNEAALNTFLDAVSALLGLMEIIDDWSDEPDMMLQCGCWAIDLDPKSPTFIGNIYVPLPCEFFEMKKAATGSAAQLMELLSMMGEAGGFQFYILQSESIMNMIMGNPFDIVGFTLPQLELGIDVDIDFDLGPVEFGIDGGVLLHLGKVGIIYDSTGLEKIIDALKNDNTPDYLDILDGFYISNEPGKDFRLKVWLDAYLK